MPFCQFPDCEAYAMNDKVPYCGTHAAYLRKSERDEKKAALKKPQKIAKMSEKKADKVKSYAPMRRQYLKENPVCEIGLAGCDGNSSEIHHCSMSALDFLEISTWKASCQSCHRKVETELSAEERRNLGLLIDPVNKKFD